MYEAVFIDIDGTLRNNKKELTNKTIEVIKEVTKNGYLVILCSGRPRKYTEDVSKKCFASKYIITSNGGNIYDYENNKVLYTNKMNEEACIQLYNIAKEAKTRFMMNVGENRIVNQLKYFDGSEVLLKEDINTFVKNNDVVQCVIADSDYDKIKSLKPYIEKIKNVEIKNQHKSLINESFPKEGTIYYDIANIGSSKGNAIKEFCKILNIDLKNTIAIGDDYNDVSMFKIAGYSVVMQNANNEVKKYADYITLSNEENGVAVFLEKLLKNEI